LPALICKFSVVDELYNHTYTNLQLTTYDLQLMTYNLQLMT